MDYIAKRRELEKKKEEEARKKRQESYSQNKETNYAQLNQQKNGQYTHINTATTDPYRGYQLANKEKLMDLAYQRVMNDQMAKRTGLTSPVDALNTINQKKNAANFTNSIYMNRAINAAEKTKQNQDNGNTGIKIGKGIDKETMNLLISANKVDNKNASFNLPTRGGENSAVSKLNAPVYAPYSNAGNYNSDNLSDFYERASYLANKGVLTDEEKKEAKEIVSASKSGFMGVNNFQRYLVENPEQFEPWTSTISSLQAKTQNAVTAAATGFLESVAGPMDKAARYIQGKAGYENPYMGLSDIAAYGAQSHPISSVVGNIAGETAKIAGASEIVKPVANVAGSKIIQNIVSGGLVRGLNKAYSNTGDVFAGNKTASQAVADTGIESLSGMAGGALSSGASAELANVLRKTGLSKNIIANTVASGLSGAIYQTGSDLSKQLAREFGYNDGENITAEQLFKDALAGAAFSSIDYIIRSGINWTSSGPEDNGKEYADQWFKDVPDNESDLRRAYRALSRQYHPDNGGDEEIMKQINKAFDYRIRNLANSAAESYTRASHNPTPENKADFTNKANALVSLLSEIQPSTELNESINIINSIVNSTDWISGQNQYSNALTGITPQMRQQYINNLIANTTPAPTVETDIPFVDQPQVSVEEQLMNLANESIGNTEGVYRVYGEDSNFGQFDQTFDNKEDALGYYQHRQENANNIDIIYPEGNKQIEEGSKQPSSRGETEKLVRESTFGESDEDRQNRDYQETLDRANRTKGDEFIDKLVENGTAERNGYKFEVIETKTKDGSYYYLKATTGPKGYEYKVFKNGPFKTAIEAAESYFGTRSPLKTENEAPTVQLSSISERAKQFPEDVAKVYEENYTPGTDLVSYDDNMKIAYNTGKTGESLRTVSDNESFTKFSKENYDAVESMWGEGYKEAVKGLGTFEMSLVGSSNPILKDGISYSIKNTGTAEKPSYKTEIYNGDYRDYVLDTRKIVYSGGPFSSKIEAAKDLYVVAKNNGFLAENADAKTGDNESIVSVQENDNNREPKEQNINTKKDNTSKNESENNNVPGVTTKTKSSITKALIKDGKEGGYSSGYLKTSDGKYIITDGKYFIFQFENEPSWIPAAGNTKVPADNFEKILADSESKVTGNGVEISRPGFNEALLGKNPFLDNGMLLRNEKSNGVEYQALYFSENGPKINAKYMRGSLELIRKPVVYYKDEKTPIIVKGENGTALLLGIHSSPEMLKEVKKEYAKHNKEISKSETKDNVSIVTGSPQKNLSNSILSYLKAGKQITPNELYSIANDSYGGTMAEGSYSIKDAYDGMELAVNKYLMQNGAVIEKGNGSVEDAKDVLNETLKVLNLLPTQNKRTEEQESFQQFSTPPNIAYIAARVANVNDNDVVLEPSAGIGGLALFPKAWGATVYANELSERRLQFLNELGLDGTYNFNAEQIDNLLPDEIKPTVVIMNPPFSATAGRIKGKNDTKNAIRHITQALDRLEYGGRLVAILGRGMSDESPTFKSWWNEIREDYTIRANIQINGENYKKYGTTFDVQIVVIDKIGKQEVETITGEYTDLGKAINVLEEVRNERTRVEGIIGNTAESVPVKGTRSELPGGNTSVIDGRAGSISGNSPRDEKRGSIRSNNEGGKTGRLQPETAKGEKEPAGKGVESGTGRTGNSGGFNGNAVNEPALERDSRPDTIYKHGKLKENFNVDKAYADYVPSKARFKGSKQHPAQLVESAAMAAVAPPDVTYTPKLPQKLIESGYPSDAQLENIVYAGQAHEQILPDGRRKGFFIGDGTGVGKGVQIASIILDNFNNGRKKAIWISEKAKLINDAKRDWKDLGNNASDVFDMSKYKNKEMDMKEGIVFGTYDTLRSRGEEGIDKLKRWLGDDFDGVIVFDEAHNMGNAIEQKSKRGKSKPSQKALMGIALQDAFPNARVVYASATGATEPSNYAYLSRLGLWGKGTAFTDFNDFMSKISNGGLAAMELVARDMKSLGLYMARSISYDDVKYDTLQHELTPMQVDIYNKMSDAWQIVFQNIEKALIVTGADKNGQAKKNALGQFYSTEQRFYNQILTSMSMPSVIEDIKTELANGRSIVIQLVNTNEAAAKRAIAKNAEEGGDLDEIDLTPSEMLIQMIDKSFPVNEYEEYTDDNGNKQSRPVYGPDGQPVISKKALKMKEELIDQLNGMRVPDGPLEMLFDAFGVENVAEVTGRTRRIVEVKQPDGSYKRVIENRSEESGVADTNMFQDGKKRILVFSDAGGTGRSYHADRRAKNQQQRVHYLLQAGWNASKAVQGFGRSHRSNQSSAPIFRLVTTNVKGQKRFISTIARRLDQLGALTKGQRNTGSGMFGEMDNLENPIAMDALARYYRTVDRPILKKLGIDRKIYDQYGAINESSADLRDVGKFLNRILALRIDEQNAVFDGFFNTFQSMMETAIANGTADRGVENYKADKIEVFDEKTIREGEGGSNTKYIQLKVYNKTKETKYSELKKIRNNFSGIYKLDDGSVRAVYELPSRTNERTGEVERVFRLDTPVKEKFSRFVETTLNAKATKLPESEWKDAWENEISKLPEYSDETLHMLTGTLLPVWDKLPADYAKVIRIVTTDGNTYLGRVIKPDQIDSVLRQFGVGRSVKKYTASEVISAINDGKEVRLTNDRARIVRSRVSGEWRTEIKSANTWYLPTRYPGVFVEKIQWEQRAFIPSGEKGDNIITDIIADNPVKDIVTKGAEILESRKPVADESEWTTSRMEGNNAEPKRITEILADIAHAYGISITSGHVRGAGVAGTFNTLDNGIRTKDENALPTALHEFGHYLYKKYDLGVEFDNAIKKELHEALGKEGQKQYNKKLWETEGWAEFARQFFANRKECEKKYPKTTDMFLNSLDAEDLARITALADDVNAYYAVAAENAQSSIISRSEKLPDYRTLKEKANDAYEVFVIKALDAKAPIKKVSKNAHLLAQNAAYADSIVSRIFKSRDLTDWNAKRVGPGLKTVFEDLKLSDKQYMLEFNEYLVNLHGTEWVDNNLEVYANPVQNSKSYMERRQKEALEKHPEFKKAAQDLINWGKLFKQVWMVDTGLISQELSDELDEKYPNYLPFYRAFVKEGDNNPNRNVKRSYINQNSPVKRAKGSGALIYYPVENVFELINQTVNAAIKNRVAQEMASSYKEGFVDAKYMTKIDRPLVPQTFNLQSYAEDILEGVIMYGDQKEYDDMVKILDSLDHVMTKFVTGRTKGTEFTVLVNGKPEYYMINDPLLFEAVSNISPVRMSPVLRAIGACTRLISMNATGGNPIWSLGKNTIMDAQTLANYDTQTEGIKGLGELFGTVFKTYVYAYRERFKDGGGVDPYYLEFLALGGGNSSINSFGKDYSQDYLKTYNKTRLQKILYNLRPDNLIEFISDIIEAGPRGATYILARRNGIEEQDAFRLSMDVTVDFRQYGTLSKETNIFAEFFNANVQSTYKYARHFSAEDVDPSIRKKTSKQRIIRYIASSILLAGIFASLSRKEKKDYERLSSYTKNNYFCIPLGDDKWITIPKGRELSIPISFFERVVELTGGNKNAFDEFYDYFVDMFLPNILSDIAKFPVNVKRNGLSEAYKSMQDGILGSLNFFGVAYNMGANRDFLGRPIESTAMQNETAPENRFDGRTSQLAKMIGEVLHVSPTMLDYFGTSALGYLYKVQKSLFPVDSKNRDVTLGLKQIYTKDGLYSTDITNNLYSLKEKQALAYSRKDSVDNAIKYELTNELVTFYGKYYKLDKNENDRETRRKVLDEIQDYLNYDYNFDKNIVLKTIKEHFDKNLLPDALDSKIKNDGVEYQLTASQYYEYQGLYNNNYYAYAQGALKDGMTEEEQKNVLKYAKSKAASDAKKTMLEKIVPGYTNEDKYYGIDAASVVTFQSKLAKANEDGSTTNDEIMDIALEMIKSGTPDDVAGNLYYERTDDKYFQEWSGSTEDYLNYKQGIADLKAENKDKGLSTEDSKKEVAKEIKSYGISEEAAKVLWEIAGYSVDSTKNGKTIEDGNFDKYFSTQSFTEIRGNEDFHNFLDRTFDSSKTDQQKAAETVKEIDKLAKGDEISMDDIDYMYENLNLTDEKLFQQLLVYAYTKLPKELQKYDVNEFVYRYFNGAKPGITKHSGVYYGDKYNVAR